MSYLWPTITARHLDVSKSQTRMVLSLEHVTSVRPFPLTLQLFSLSVWPVSVVIQVPEEQSHTRSVLSLLAETTMEVRGTAATALIPSV